VNFYWITDNQPLRLYANKINLLMINQVLCEYLYVKKPI